MRPANSVSIEKLVYSTVLLWGSMGYKCEMVPTKLMLGDFNVRLVGNEMEA